MCHSYRQQVPPCLCLHHCPWSTCRFRKTPERKRSCITWWQEQWTAVLVVALGPDLIWRAILGMGWCGGHVRMLSASWSHCSVGLALRKLELLHCKLPVILSKENLTMSSDIIRCHNPMEVTWINTCWAQVRSLQCIVSFLCIRTSSGAGLSLILSRSMTTLSPSLFYLADFPVSEVGDKAQSITQDPPPLLKYTSDYSFH